jgi:hypothetical protein
MKITVTKVIQELQEKHGWECYLDQPHTRDLIRDVLKIIDQKLKYHKGISIK